MTIALAIHGGAGASRKLSYERVRDHLHSLVESARDALLCGAAAVDVVTETVVVMEASGLYVAGKGASPNAAGEYELDACVMDGAKQAAGAVACLGGYAHPVRVARAVMENTPHVLLAGAGAAAFARSIGAARVPPSGNWYTHAGEGESNFASTRGAGTVGCVALDLAGALASATSTSGVFDKMPGRISDTPMVGAGTWADRKVAVSCTGQGDFFIRTAASARLASLVAAGAPLETAARDVLAAITALGGEGGLISVDEHGNLACPFTAEGMKRAVLTSAGEIRVAVFED